MADTLLQTPGPPRPPDTHIPCSGTDTHSQSLQCPVCPSFPMARTQFPAGSGAFPSCTTDINFWDFRLHWNPFRSPVSSPYPPTETAKKRPSYPIGCSRVTWVFDAYQDSFSVVHSFPGSSAYRMRAMRVTYCHWAAEEEGQRMVSWGGCVFLRMVCARCGLCQCAMGGGGGVFCGGGVIPLGGHLIQQNL